MLEDPQDPHGTIALSTAGDMLSSLGVPPCLVEAGLRIIPGEAIGLLIYGSRARDDFVHDSDLDLLALVKESGESRTLSGVNLICYTSEQLRSASGTLFGMHIRRDGRVLADATGEIEELVQALQDPDPSQLIARVRHYSSVLEAGESELEFHLPGLCRLARYLLRTAIYALAIAQGRPCFSVRELARRFADPKLVTLLSSHPNDVGDPSVKEFAELRSRLRTAVGRPAVVRYGSLEALAVAEWDSDRELSTLAILAMTGEGGDLDYAELPKVLL